MGPASRHQCQPAITGYNPHGPRRAVLPYWARFHTQPTLPHEHPLWENQTAGVAGGGGAQLWTRQKDGQGAKAYPRKSVWGLFSLAGGGYRGFHSPWRQSQG